MLKRHNKTDQHEQSAPARVLVVDDNPDAARLLTKLFRRAGYEVADVADHQVALATLQNEPAPISAVVIAFSNAGNSACLKLLDAIRHTPDTKVNAMRAVLLLDSARQLLFSWQSGADDILARPFHADDLIAAVGAAIDRPESQRAAYRREQMQLLREADEMSDAVVGAARYA